MLQIIRQHQRILLCPWLISSRSSEELQPHYPHSEAGEPRFFAIELSRDSDGREVHTLRLPEHAEIGNAYHGTNSFRIIRLDGQIFRVPSHVRLEQPSQVNT